MSIEIDDVSSVDGVSNCANWALQTGLWDGRLVSYSSFPHSASNKPWITGFLEIIGKGMIDPDLMDLNVSSISHERSSRFTTIGTKEAHIRIGGINGMNTSWDHACSHADYIASFTPHQSIDWVYNRSHGPLIDLAEVFSLNYLGHSPNTAALLQENWTEFHQQNASRPSAKYLQLCHSQGAIHVCNALASAPKEIQSRVIVVAIAPAEIVSKDICYKAFNYACKGDIVPYGELVFSGALDTTECGISQRSEMALQHREQLIWLDPHPDAGNVHDFQGITFAEKIEERIKEYLAHRGAYE
ncbi:MAG: hypothetical protein HY861_00395 [Chlamydiia bacterium]|nr:hypothetical protein [Chlamydiia bacterium]